jgi:hypothetical protein
VADFDRGDHGCRISLASGAVSWMLGGLAGEGRGGDQGGRPTSIDLNHKGDDRWE